jgi:hypothetical protein
MRALALSAFVLPLAACAAPGEAALAIESEVSILPECSEAKLAEILAPATSSRRTVNIDCSFSLGRRDVVTKRMVFYGGGASGAHVSCNGATIDGGNGTINAGGDMIEVRSRKYADDAGRDAWERPVDIEIDGCHVIGSTRIWGMGQNGQAADVKTSSLRDSGHPTRARNAAPRNIIFRNMEITGISRIPIYVSPGVTYFQLYDSEVNGKTSAVSIYFDAESAYNVLRGNDIHAGGDNREVMAIDGSSSNLIVDNRFSSLYNGGIYIYRNCGEGGAIRHSTPSSNQIINNVFYYREYSGSAPAVYIGSRDASSRYCDDDSGYPWGSSASDRDNARYNVVMQNQIYVRSVSDMIKVQRPTVNFPNFISRNTSVSTETSRSAGCYLSSTYGSDFLYDGQVGARVSRTRRGAIVCEEVRCDDGDLSVTGSCDMQEVYFECSASNTNAGCTTSAACPSGTRVLAATATCNLETSSLDWSTVDGAEPGQVSVVTASDNWEDGNCFVGSTDVPKYREPARGSRISTSLNAGCSERDSNGGDCRIRGIMYCR